MPSLIDQFVDQTAEYSFMAMDPDGTITSWRGAAEKIFGYRESEVLGRHASLLFTSEDAQKGFDKHELSIAAKDSRSEDDRWHVRKDGTRIWMTGSVQAIRAHDGTLLGFVKVMRDRTDLRIHMDSLENQLAMREGAVSRTRSFLRTLGHELRNPLAPLRMAAEIIRRQPAAEQVTSSVATIQNQVEVLARLADELMDVSRLDAGVVALALELTDLRTQLEEACVTFGTLAREKGVDLQLILPAGPLPVKLDAPRFRQVTSNLLTNAIKYTPAGGQIWVKPTQEGREVVFRVEDTGIGIPPELLPRLFDLFSRGHSAQELAPTGLGVGLSVVREIVELHGGTVQARSAGSGKGTEVTVRLPAAGEDRRTEKKEAPHL